MLLQINAASAVWDKAEMNQANEMCNRPLPKQVQNCKL